MSRWILFLITIAIGLAAGLGYAWFVNPVQYVDTSPNTLRTDYKADYVLMVAETYQVDGDLGAAVRRLAALGEKSPAAAIEKASQFAEQQHYAQADKILIQKLANAIQVGNPVQATPKP
jgi:hypothetical protein